MGPIKEQGNRNRDKLFNMDGNEMSVEDYMQIVKEMQETGQPPKIANFGWSQSAINQLNVEEKQLEKLKSKDYMIDILNS